MTNRLALAALGLALTAAPALAQGTAPGTTTPVTPAIQPAPEPAAAVRLSEVLAKIEAEPGFVRFEDIEWDNSDSLWDIDYHGTGGRKVSVSINGTTGEPVVQ